MPIRSRRISRYLFVANSASLTSTIRDNTGQLYMYKYYIVK